MRPNYINLHITGFVETHEFSLTFDIIQCDVR